MKVGELLRQRGTCLLVSLVMSLLVLSLGVPINEGIKQRCLVNGRDLAHKHNFTDINDSHCVEYGCDDGKTVVHKDGCQYEAVCHPVDSTFDFSCKTFTCTKSSQNGHTNYQSVLTRIRCKDYYGECHEQGSQFSFVINDQLSNRCTCTVFQNGTVRTGCPVQ